MRKWLVQLSMDEKDRVGAAGSKTVSRRASRISTSRSRVSERGTRPRRKLMVRSKSIDRVSAETSEDSVRDLDLKVAANTRMLPNCLFLLSAANDIVYPAQRDKGLTHELSRICW